MIYKLVYVNNDLKSLPTPITITGIDSLIATYLTHGYEIEENKEIIVANRAMQWIFFFTNTKRIKNGHDNRVKYIMKHLDLLTDKGVVDNLYALIYKCDFKTLKEFSLECNKNASQYARRFSYAMFFSHVDREKSSFANEILSLIKDDDPIVVEAMAKLVYEIALFNPNGVYLALSKKQLSKDNAKLIIDLLLKSTRLDDSHKNRFKFLLDNYEN